MNSMNNLVSDLKLKFEILQVEFPIKNQFALDINSRDTHAVLSHLKAIGFKQLSLLTCVDWIKENVFQLVYIVFNWDTGIRIQVRTKIDRNNPKFLTIRNIYPGVEYYERDVHEFFGVEFEGNENSYKDLFLELWDAPPPMKKDFDPMAFSLEKYPEREYKTDFKTKVVDEQ
jgi:NADH-quinone oxidoreductase subunit C